MSIRRRLERLEAQRSSPPTTPPRSAPTTLDEIRALEEHIRDLEAEIRAEGGTVELEPPGVLPGDLEAIEREIEALELMEVGRG